MVSVIVVVVMVPWLLSGASAQTPQATAHTDPAANLPYTFADSLAAVNAGRSDEGLTPITTRGFTELTSAEEVFVVLNLERVARSLPPFEEMTASLDTLAQAGADVAQDPAPPPSVGSPWSYAGIESGATDPLLADFGWMYEDGCTPVADQRFVNRDCGTSPSAPWGHRNDILESFPSGPGCQLVMGAAQGQGVPSLAAVFEGYCGAPAPDDPVFTWQQAEAIVGLPVTAPAAAPAAAAPAPAASCPAPRFTLGYRTVASDGGVFSFGDMPFCGSTGADPLHQPVVGMATTPDRGGYWLAAADGGVFAFGDATYYGSLGGTRLARPIVGIAAAPFGNGYWLVASDGGVFAFGVARYYGSLGGTRLRAPIVGIAVSPFGLGYWLVSADGGVFAFGEARFYGSLGGTSLRAPVVGIAASPFGSGYWLVASDGGVFAFGDNRFYGSMGATPLARPIVGISAAPLGLGYWLVASDGGVFGFGDGRFYGSTGGARLDKPVVAISG